MDLYIRYLLMIGLRGLDSCCNFYIIMYIYFFRKSLKNIIVKYLNVKDKIWDLIKKIYINNVVVYYIFFIILIYVIIFIIFIIMICEVLFYFIKS